MTRLTLAALALICASAAHAQEIASTDKAEVCAWVNGQSYSQRHRVVHRTSVPGAELDHIVPLCAGGADTDKNSQVQPWPEAHLKDRVEAEACRMVCAGQLVLTDAQAWFTGDWRDAYHRLYGAAP